MLHPNAVACLAVVILGSRLFTAVAFADEGETLERHSQALTFAARVENGEFVGEEQIRRLYVTSGSNQCGCIVPSGLRVDVSRSDRVTLTASDLSYFVTLRILGNIPNEGFRQQAIQHYPGALLTDETSAEAAGRRGTMFNMRWKPAVGVDRMVTVIFIPHATRVLEFSVVADHGKFAEAKDTLLGLLQRFQIGEQGRLRMETFRQPDYN